MSKQKTPDLSVYGNVEADRVPVSRNLDPARRAELGQFFTPNTVARFMAGLFRAWPDEIRLLDPGAGVGNLTAAFVQESSSRKPKKLQVTLYELDELLAGRLASTVRLLDESCKATGIEFDSELFQEDFVKAGASYLQGDLFGKSLRPRFNRIITNPPYRKIHSDSSTRHDLRAIGIETTNLYSAFLAVAVRLLEPNGELVAITPRSFCNGPYFRPFRHEFFREMTLTHLHVFESRGRAFSGDDVLQENVIFHAVKSRKRGRVTLSVSEGPDDPVTSRVVHHDDIVWPSDPEQFVHLVLTDDDDKVTRAMRAMPCALDDLGISVSTGRVVDFRAKEFLRKQPSTNTVPLIYPCHFDDGFVSWPTEQRRKPNALLDSEETRFLLVPQGTYTLTKRFTSKEERRRVVAAVYEPGRVQAEAVGFENHLNYFHKDGTGLDPVLARGLACFLNSTLVDRFFRLFSGHTQVNATDLRLLRYPSVKQLRQLAKGVGDRVADQAVVDAAVAQLIPQDVGGKDSALKCFDGSSRIQM